MRERERKKKKLSHTNILRMRGEKGTISKRKRKKNRSNMYAQVYKALQVFYELCGANTMKEW